MIPNKLAKQFILLNLTNSFLPLTNKYALCPFELSICSFLRLIQREHRYPKLYGRLDRVTFDHYATANYKDLYEKKTFFSSI